MENKRKNFAEAEEQRIYEEKLVSGSETSIEEKKPTAFDKMLVDKMKKTSNAGRKKSDHHRDHKILINLDDELFEYVERKAKYHKMPLTVVVVTALAEKMRAEEGTADGK